VRQAPPTFLLFVNRDEIFSDQYKKYLGGELRRRSATKAARLCWCRKRARKPSSRSEIQAGARKAAGKGRCASRGASRKIFPQAQEKIALKFCSQWRISRHVFNAGAEIPLISFANIFFVTFLQNFLATTIYCV
jgi:hypothetical protein